jgi:hypothetical protein
MLTQRACQNDHESFLRRFVAPQDGTLAVVREQSAAISGPRDDDRDRNERTTARSSHSNTAAKNKHYWHSNLKT